MSIFNSMYTNTQHKPENMMNTYHKRNKPPPVDYLSNGSLFNNFSQ